MEVSSIEELSAIVERAEAYRRRDDRVSVSGIGEMVTHGTASDFTLTNAYIGFLLPLQIELQYIAERRRPPEPGHRKSKATLMAPDSVWVARAVKASRHWASRKVWVSMPDRSIRPSRHQVQEVEHGVLADAFHLLDAEGVRPHPGDLLEVER